MAGRNEKARVLTVDGIKDAVRAMEMDRRELLIENSCLGS